MLAELGENASVYSWLPKKKNYQIPMPFLFDFRKGKTGILWLQDHNFA